MRGESCPPDTILARPVSVVSRGSTDAVFTADPELRGLVRYIRERACEGLTLDDLVLHASLSRSTLSAGSRRISIVRRPRKSIAQLARLKELLARTDLPLGEIARVSGFQHFETMHRFFKAHVGTTPSAYRAACRKAGLSDAADTAGNPIP